MIKEDDTKQKEGQEVPKNKKHKENKESQLEKQVEELTAKLAESKDANLRIYAEFDTFRRRSAEDRLSLVGTATADLVKDLIPVLDAFEQGLKILKEGTPEREGTQLIYDKMMAVLKKKGLETVDAKGKAFDADMHEAVAQIPAPDESLQGVVLDVTRTGYSLNGKIVRYPQVVVGA